MGPRGNQGTSSDHLLVTCVKQLSTTQQAGILHVLQACWGEYYSEVRLSAFLGFSEKLRDEVLCKGNLRRRLRMRAEAEARRGFRYASTRVTAKGDPKFDKSTYYTRVEMLTCKGGSKEDRDGDPLRKAKVYIQCTRMHMEERVCGVRD